MARAGRLIERLSACLALAAALVLASCGGGPVETAPAKRQQNKEATLVRTPLFSADSAYAFVERQVAFGNRVPNSAGHRKCGDYLIGQLEAFGAAVTVQEARVKAYDGTNLDIRNIFGAFNPREKRRILLYAHWDTRPYADKDSVRTKEPIDGANDGASGVGVLLDLARIMSDSLPKVGVDIAFLMQRITGSPSGCPTAIQITPTGVSVLNIGRASPTFPVTGPSMAYCWTWWAQRGPSFTGRGRQWPWPLPSSKKCGPPPDNWGMPISFATA